MGNLWRFLRSSPIARDLVIAALEVVLRTISRKRGHSSKTK